MESGEVLPGADATDLVAGNVYDIADMLLQGDSADNETAIPTDQVCSSQGSMEQLLTPQKSTPGGSGMTGLGETSWVNPLANIQAYSSVEPQALLQEMLQDGASYYNSADMYYSGVGHGGVAVHPPIPAPAPNIVPVSPSEITTMEQRSGNFGKDQASQNLIPAASELEQSQPPVGNLMSMISEAAPLTQEPHGENHLGSLMPTETIKSEPMDNAFFTSDTGVEEHEDEDQSSSPENSEEEESEEEPEQPQYNIVSLDPTAFSDAKVKSMQPVGRAQHESRTERDVGRRSQSKHKAKPRKLLEGADPLQTEPPLKRSRRDDLKMTINLKDINTFQGTPEKSKTQTSKRQPPGKKRGRGRPRTRPAYVPTGRPRGRPPKSGQCAQPKLPKQPQVKTEPYDPGYDDNMSIEDGDDTADVDFTLTYAPPGLRKREQVRNRSVKGTHIMMYKEYRCFECNDKKLYTDKEAFLEHWKGVHFVLEDDGANLYCTQCRAKYSVYLKRFHRATDVLQYIAFYFNHKVKRHSMDVPPYIEEMKCPQEGCYFTSYTSYGLSRHLEEGKHRSRPPRSYRLLGQDGPVKDSSVDESYVPGQGNKYSLIFKEFKCFVCSDDTKFTDISSMLVHWRDNHFQFSEAEAIIPCGFCDAVYKVPRNRFHRQTDTMQYIAYFFSHLVKRHKIQVPPYIEQLSCSQPGCKFVTYTKQLLQRHLQEVKHITLSRTPALEGGDLVQGPGLRSPYLSFKSYCCFMCVDDQGQHQGPFENGATYAEHWRQTHFTLDQDKVFLQCPSCTMLYQIQVSRFPRNADVLAVIARFFTHMVKKHNLESPDYIEQLHCSVPGCPFKCYTPQILDGHRMTKRDPAHMGVLVDVYGSKNLPTLSLRTGPKPPSTGTAISPEKDISSVVNQESIHQRPEQLNAEAPTENHMERNVGTQEVLNPAPDPSAAWNATHIATLSKQIAEGVLKSLAAPDTALETPNMTEATELDTTLDSSLNQGGSGNLEDSIDTTDMKAKSLLCFTDAIRCFECQDNHVFKDHNDFVNHWRHNHFVIGNFEVYITCRVCGMRIGLNKPLWHRDHDIGRCVASYLTHCMKKHGVPCPNYVKELECPEPGCGYKTLTVKHLQFHVRHTKHHKLEKAKKVAAGIDPTMDSNEVIRRSTTFRVNDNGLTFKEYQCYLCADGVFYKNCLDYETHWRTTHVTNHEDKDCLRCHICGTTFISHLYPSIAFLFCHLVKKHEFEVPWYIEEYTCEEQHCNYVTYTKALLMKHKQGQRHASGSGVFQYYLNFQEYRCFLCESPGTVFPSKKVFEAHLLSQHVEKGTDNSSGDYFRCPECDHRFTLHHCKKPELNYDKPDPSRTLCVLFNHIVVKHKWEIPSYIMSFKCPHDDCSFVTVRKYTLDRHVASHTADQQCYQCGMFFSKTRIEKHFKKCLSGKPPGGRTTAGPKSFPCPECGVSMVQKKALKRHMQEAHGKNMEDCGDLPQGGGQKYKKMKASETGLAYKCDECGKVLLEKKSMKRHMQSVHLREAEPHELYTVQHETKLDEGPKHFECMLCGVQMNLMKSVKRHMMKQHSLRVGTRDLESSYVKVDPDAPLRPYTGQVQKRKQKSLLRRPDEGQGSHGLTTIDESEISDFTSAQRAFTANSPENQALASQELAQPTLVEMTTVQHLQNTRTDIDMMKLTQQSIFPTPKPVPSTTIASSTNQALDFSMRLTELEVGEIPTSSTHRMELLTQRITGGGAASEALPLELPNSASLMAASRHLHNGQPMQMSLPQADRLELLTQRMAPVQPVSMGGLPGTVHPRDINVMPVDFRLGVGNLQPASTADLLNQRLTGWNLPNQS